MSPTIPAPPLRYALCLDGAPILVVDREVEATEIASHLTPVRGVLTVEVYEDGEPPYERAKGQCHTECECP